MKTTAILTLVTTALTAAALLACGTAATPEPPKPTPVAAMPPIDPSAYATPYPTTVGTPVPRSDVKTDFAEPLSSGLSVADIIEKALPSVVQIIATSDTGTGFIVRESGLVVTNKHVVQGASQVTLRLASGGNFQGRVSERHPSLDLAYIEIDANRSFTPIAIGDSDIIRVGEQVIAVGFPLGQSLGSEPTVSVGIISAKRDKYLQTDAALNPGNSGGPLLNIIGEAIGVVSSRVDSTDGGRTVSGIGFAIPINTVDSNLRGKASQSTRGLATPTPIPTAKVVPPGRTARPAPTPTSARQPTATPRPTATPLPMPTPTAIPWKPLFDYSQLLPQTEPKPNWQKAVERWKSLEWFEEVCATGEAFQLAGGIRGEILGKGTLTQIEYYEEPFPMSEFSAVIYERPGFNPYPLGAIYMSDDAFGTFGVTCVLIDKHVDVGFACYEASCVENIKIEILSDQLAFILFHNGGDNSVQAKMRCVDGGSECPLGRIWIMSFLPPTPSNISQYQNQSK